MYRLYYITPPYIKSCYIYIVPPQVTDARLELVFHRRILYLSNNILYYSNNILYYIIPPQVTDARLELVFHPADPARCPARMALLLPKARVTVVLCI